MLALRFTVLFIIYLFIDIQPFQSCTKSSVWCLTELYGTRYFVVCCDVRICKDNRCCGTMAEMKGAVSITYVWASGCMIRWSPAGQITMKVLSSCHNCWSLKGLIWWQNFLLKLCLFCTVVLRISKTWILCKPAESDYFDFIMSLWWCFLHLRLH